AACAPPKTAGRAARRRRRGRTGRARARVVPRAGRDHPARALCKARRAADAAAAGGTTPLGALRDPFRSAWPLRARTGGRGRRGPVRARTRRAAARAAGGPRRLPPACRARPAVLGGGLARARGTEAAAAASDGLRPPQCPRLRRGGLAAQGALEDDGAPGAPDGEGAGGFAP